jgi:predicted anti-sigma-YlaC factor YlaD
MVEAAGARTPLQKIIQIEITCRQVWREVSNFLEDDLTPELRLRIEKHLSLCTHCRALMDGTRNTVAIVADERALELPDGVRRRLYSRWIEHLEKSKR